MSRLMRHSILVAAAGVVAACGGGQENTTTTATAGGAASEPTAEPEPAQPKASTDVEPVPEEMHSLTPHLVVPDVEKAMAFYRKAFGTEQRELIRTPEGNPMHAEITLGDSVLMLSPQNEKWKTKAPESAGGTCGGVMVYVEDVDAAFERALEAGATEIMPVQDMFWGDRYGQVEDPYGHRWSLATHQYDLSEEELDKRAKAWGKAMAAGEEPPEFEGGEPAESFKADGFFTVTPSLVVSGPDTIAFYEKAFGAERRDVMKTPDGKLMHAEVKIGDSILMLTGEHPEQDQDMRAPSNLDGVPFSLMHYVEDADTTFEKAVDAGADKRTAVREMFWGDRYGEVVGASGHRWGIATRVANLTDEQIQRRMRQHMRKQHGKHESGQHENEGSEGAGEPPGGDEPGDRAEDEARATSGSSE